MIKLYNADCFDILKEIPANSVDMILTDLPYEETGNKWDSMLNLRKLFNEFRRITTESACWAFTGTFKFGVQLFNTAPDLYKYDWVWEKDNGTNAPNVNHQPFRIHENIYIFGKGRVTNGTRTPMTYNPQKTDGKPYVQKSGKMSDNWKGGLKNVVTENLSGLRHPKTIQKFTRDKVKFHPTQKPVTMLEYLIMTYSNEGMTVLDCCMGSGSCGVAAKNTNRSFIGIEKDSHYFQIAEERIGILK